MQRRQDIYSEYSEQVESIQYYDKLQFSLRRFSLTLLMGTFGAIFFVFSLNPERLSMNPIVIVFFLCFISILVNFAIATYDLIFVERLLMSCYIEALKLEEQHSWIFPIHTRMLNLETKKHHGTTTNKVRFYIGLNIDIIVLMLIIISLFSGFQNWIFIVFVLIPISGLSMLIVYLCMRKIAISSERKFDIFLSAVISNLEGTNETSS